MTTTSWQMRMLTAFLTIATVGGALAFAFS